MEPSGPRAARLLYTVRRHSAATMFVAGFLFDLLTIGRIDAWRDLALQLGYLAGLTLLLVGQQREATGRWNPGRFASAWWQYNVEALHFLYGGLLSAYVVLYFRSSTIARPVVFLGLLVVVMVLNEVPRLRGAGYRLRLGLYAFCVLSFLTYFVPILAGRMNGWTFLVALASSAGVVFLVTCLLTPATSTPAAERRRLFAPGATVLTIIGVLYLLRLIPPVPLSVQFQGIYHDVRREAGVFRLAYEAPPAWAFWRHDSRPFRRREGDRVHYFVRLFAPVGFRHRVILRWEVFDRDAHVWRTTDRIPLDVTGGRAEGFRGTAVKANVSAGDWRVTAETEDGRAIATLPFEVAPSSGTDEREWQTITA